MINFSRLFLTKITFLLTLIFLYFPIVILVLFSFNDSKRNIVWKGFTLKYYFKLINNQDLIEAFLNSIVIAFMSTALSVILAVLCGYSLWKLAKKKMALSSAYEGVLALPIVIPEICLAIGFLVFYQEISWPQGLVWPLNLMSIIIAHVTFSFPFATMIIRSKLNTFNLEIEQGAIDLGATAYQVFKNFILPHLNPAIFTAIFLSITLSLDDFIITFFTSTPGVVTLPVKIYSMVRFSITPEVNAASSIFIFLTLCTAFLGLISYQVYKKNGRPKS